MTDFLRAQGIKKTYSVSYTNKKDIVLPSHKKQVDTFIEMYKGKTRKELVSQVSLENARRHYLMDLGIGNLSTKELKNSSFYNEFKEQYGALKGKDLESTGYHLFIKAYSDMPISSLYNKKLEKQGYNAIYDENDTRYNTELSRTPTSSIIGFNRNNLFDRKNSTEITKKEYDDINRQLKKS